MRRTDRPHAKNRKTRRGRARERRTGRQPPRGLRAAIAAHEEGRVDEALRLYRLFLAVRPDDIDALNLAGIAAIQAGAYEAAVKSLGAALERNPEASETHYNLGVALTRLERLDEAEAALRRALAVKPGYAEARKNLRALAGRGRPEHAVPQILEAAVAHHRAGRAEVALEGYRRVLSVEPENVDALNLGGVALVQAGDIDEALRLLERAVALAPERADVHYNLGRALMEAERLEDAAAALRRAVELAPEDAQAHNNLGAVLTELARPDEAELALRHAVALRADYAEAHNNLGAVLLDVGRLDEALSAVRRALDIDPDYAAAHNNLGAALRDLGNIEQAAASFRRAVEIAPDHGEAYGNIYSLKTLAPREDDIAAMRALLSGPAVGNRQAIVLCFALAGAYEGLGDYDRSFEFLERGNRLRRASFEYDGRELESKVEKIMSVFDRQFVARAGGEGSASCAPIFVLGMPRSGTSLVEQILASHSQVHGGGELRDFAALVDGLEKRTGDRAGYPDAVKELDREDFRRLGDAYVAAVGRRTPVAPRFTDKLPDNFLHIGLIHLALPNAKIIHCTRDAVDTCLSCYKVDFAKNGIRFAYDLGELGRYYRLYDRVMRHWRSVLRGRFLDVSYEALVEDQEAQIRRLLEHCELPWEERCLAFHRSGRAVRTASAAQVRQPIFTTSVGRWKRYERHLGPLLEILGEPRTAADGSSVLQRCNIDSLSTQNPAKRLDGPTHRRH